MIRRFLPALLIAGAVAACAAPPPPVIPRSEIRTDVADARCRAIGKTARHDSAPAPYSIDTLGLGLPVTITCDRTGYQPSSETLYPLPKAPLARALVDGALLSPMADTVPPPLVAADSPVPAGVLVPMRPVLFTTPSARDRYFGRLRTQREERWQGFAERLRLECEARSGPAGAPQVPDARTCRAARDALARQRADDLRRLEVDRRRSTFQ